MRICLVNYRYFVSSGPERYMFGVKELLEGLGHEVIPFSVRYRANEPTPWSRYFVEPIAGDEEVRFYQHTWTPRAVRRALERAFYSPEVYEGLSRLVRDTRPDVAYVLHYLRKLSPAVLTAFHDQGVPIVVRLSDFAMVCPQAHMVLHDKICEKCVRPGPWPSIPFRCVQNSLGATIVNALAMEYACLRGYFGLIDAFVTPSRIMRQKMIEGGIPAERLHEVPTFVQPRTPRPFGERRRRLCFVGRIERIKGIVAMLSAFEMVRARGLDDLELVLAGDVTTPCARDVAERLERGVHAGVTLAGHLDRAGVDELLQSSLASVVPSLWYENMPNSLLESLACGTPVIASDLGSLRDLLEGTGAGLLVPPNDADALADAMVEAVTGGELEAMGRRAHELATGPYSPARHVEALDELLRGVASPQGAVS
jgi:glycosyltransferase involved in cell wall biosynthesis